MILIGFQLNLKYGEWGSFLHGMGFIANFEISGVWTMYFYVIIAVTIIVDLATKMAIRMNLAVGERTEILGFVQLAHYENPGTSGNLFHGYARLISVVVLALVGIGFYLRSKGKFRRPVMQVGLSLMIGGAIGNTIDRLVYNQVTDFLFFSVQATMNFADIAVYAGTIILVGSQIFHEFRR